jgi:hypothetical protein
MMDQHAIDQREGIEYMLSEIEAMDLSRRPKTEDFIQSLRNQFNERLSLSPGQFQKLKEVYEQLTDI